MTPIQQYILADSDRGAVEEQRRQDNWRAGWHACEQFMRDKYEEGFLDGLLDRRRFQAAIVNELRNEETMWGPGGRAHFADPRPGDYMGGPVAPW